jgi:hypothetical protein
MHDDALRQVKLMISVSFLAACTPSEPVFVSSYRPPDAEPLAMRGEKMAAAVLMQDQEKRAIAENTLAEEISKRGAIGVPMHRILPSATPDDEATARAAIEGAGVKGVIVMRPKKVKTSITTPATTYATAAYSGFWGGYYPGVWGGMGWRAGDGPYGGWYGAPPVYVGVTHVAAHTETYEVVKVEILIYSLKQNRLVWAGETETVDPGAVDAFVENLAAGTADELRRLWLVPN